MRIVIPAVLLLLSSAGVAAHAQSRPVAEPSAPVSVSPDTQSTRAEPSAAAHAAEQASPQSAARVEAATDAEPTAVQERKRSRVVWFLVGAVAVLAIILALR